MLRFWDGDSQVQHVSGRARSCSRFSYLYGIFYLASGHWLLASAYCTWVLDVDVDVDVDIGWIGLDGTRVLSSNPRVVAIHRRYTLFVTTSLLICIVVSLCIPSPSHL